MCLVPFWYGLIGTDVTLGNSCWRHRLGGRCGGVIIMGAKEPPRLEGYTQRDEETTPEVFEGVRIDQVVRSVKGLRVYRSG